MKRTHSLTIPNPGQYAQFDFERNWPDTDMQCKGLVFDVGIPVTVANAPVTPTAATLKALVAHLFSKFVLDYGEARAFHVYSDISGANLRNAYRELTGKDLPYTELGVAQDVNDHVQHIKVPVLFDVPRRDGKQNYPGATQMRTMVGEIYEDSSSALVTNMTRKLGTNLSIDVYPIFHPGPDVWVPILGIRKVEASQLVLIGHDGVTLNVWHEELSLATAIAADSTLSYHLDIGARRVYENLSPSMVDFARKMEKLDAAGEDINDDVTVIYQAPPKVALSKLPHGPFRFEQRENYWDRPLLRQLMIPVMTDEEHEMAARLGAKTHGKAVLASGRSTSAEDSPGAPATGGVQLWKSNEHTQFFSEPGIIGHTNGQTSVSVPAAVVTRAAAVGATAAAGEAATKTSLLQQAQKIALKRFPGAIRTDGNGQGKHRVAVRDAHSHLF